jgi:hypothetical protein
MLVHVCFVGYSRFSFFFLWERGVRDWTGFAYSLGILKMVLDDNSAFEFIYTFIHYF